MLEHQQDSGTVITSIGAGTDGDPARIWSTVRDCLTAYPFTVGEIRPLDTNKALLVTPRGLLEARIVPEGSARLRRAVLDVAARHRFRMTQRFILTAYHDSVIRLSHGMVLYLTDAWPGDPLTFDTADVARAAHNLALFHRSVEQFGQENLFTEDTLASKQYGTWVEAFLRAADLFRRDRDTHARDGKSDSDTVWKEWLLRWEEQGRCAAGLLETSGYRTHMATAESEGRIAWNQYGMSCLRRMAPDGAIATLQLADPVHDDPIYDLATLCHELTMKANAAVIVRAIGVYHQERPISPSERLSIVAYAAFPHFALRWMEERGNVNKHEPPDERDKVDSTEWMEIARRQRQAALALLSASGAQIRP